MKKIFYLLILFTVSSAILKSQTLISSYPFPNYSQYNSFWGITNINDTLRIATDNNGSIYKVTETGIILDSLTTPFTFNHGLVWDGTGYWIAEQFRSAGARLYKVNTAGARVDSIQLPALIGGASGGVGDIALDGNGIWFSVYSPDFTTYPFAYAYKMDLTSRLITDTIPLRGRQVQGITVKGDTIFYVNDYFHTTPFIDPERIYAYSRTTGDTLFSFPTPDPDGDCSPRGLHWDGQFLWLIADRIGNNINLYKTLYKYSVTGSGNPQITTNTNSLDFGNTIIGTSTDRTLTISNTGTSALIISNFTNTNPRFSILPNNVPDTLNIGQTKNYTVTFTPTVFDTTSGQLRISSNDGGTPVKIVSLKGKGIFNGSNISVSDTIYNFGQRRGGSLCGFVYTIKNTGSQVLNITSMQTSAITFFPDTVGLTFPIAIDTQKTRQFRVWFHPSTGTFSDVLRIFSNAVNLPQATIALSGSSIFSLPDLGAILWQGVVPDNPFTISDYYKPVSIKQINDVNNDMVNDVIVASANYLTTCFNGNSSVTSDTLWTFNTGTNNNNSGSVTYEDAMQIRSDIDGDGIQEVVIGCGGGNEMVYTISGRTGKQIWAYGDSVNFSNGDINGVRADKDYNNDGIPDVIFSASGEASGGGRRSLICVNGLNGNVIFINPQSALFLYDVVNYQTGGAISQSNNGTPYNAQGFNNSGQNTWLYTNSDIIWSMKDINSLDSDTIRDIVGQAGFNGKVFALNSGSGTSVWERYLGPSINGNVKYYPKNFITTWPLLVDSFLIVSGQKTFNKLNPETGADIWVNSLDNSYILGSDIIGKTNRGNQFDVAAGTLGNNFYILNGITGEIKFQYSFGNGNTDFAVEKVALLGNLQYQNGNGNEIVAGSRDGRVICFSGGNYVDPLVTTISSEIPDKFSLSQNYPNPFNPTTKIKFDIANAFKDELSLVKLKVYDALGKLVQTLVNEKLSPGSYETEFNGSNLSSGMYFYKLETQNFVETKRMILIK